MPNLLQAVFILVNCYPDFKQDQFNNQLEYKKLASVLQHNANHIFSNFNDLIIIRLKRKNKKVKKQLLDGYRTRNSNSRYRNSSP